MLIFWGYPVLAGNAGEKEQRKDLMPKDFDWIGAYEAIWKADLPRRERLVLLAIHKHTNKHSATAWPTLERLQKLTGYRRPALSQAISSLEAMGILRRSKRCLLGKQYPGNCYELLLSETRQPLNTSRQFDAPMPNNYASRPCTFYGEDEEDDMIGKSHSIESSTNLTLRDIPFQKERALSSITDRSKSEPITGTCLERYEFYWDKNGNEVMIDKDGTHVVVRDEAKEHVARINRMIAQNGAKPCDLIVKDAGE